MSPIPLGSLIKNKIVTVSLFAVLSLAAHAQNPGDTCNQGQCGTGAFCDATIHVGSLQPRVKPVMT